MAVVRMPALAAGATEAAIQTWLVGVGDNVEVGQAIVEIETEKAVVEYEAESAGTVAGILVGDGDSAAVGAPIAVLAEAGESAEAALAEVGPVATPAPAAPDPASAPAASAAPAPSPAASEIGDSSRIRTDSADSSEIGADLRNRMQRADAVPPVPSEPAGAERRLFASPLVRRLAAERGIELTGLRGSGPNGRIVRRDLDAAASPAAASDIGESVRNRTDSTGSSDIGADVRNRADAAGYTDIPHTGMRRAIARRLTESKSTVPHFYLVADCRVDELLALRARINAVEGVRVSVNDLVVKAVASAFRDVPEANAIWTEEATRRFDGVDIAVAVSVPSGLLTPVVRGADRLSLTELSAQISDLAGRAREGRLKQHELEGGSFAVSNLGMYGTQEFSAILNPPQSGILAVGAAGPRPVVVDGELAVATVMTVTLSADHRVLDGALAAQWLAAFVTRIENPLSILI